MDAENRRIMEFASQQEQMEETRIAKIREREEAKEKLYKIVETPFLLKKKKSQTFVYPMARSFQRIWHHK